MPISNPMFYFSIKDPDGKLWCSTLLDAEGKHVGGKGHWGYCENFQYSKGCKFGKINTEVQDFLKEELGILGNGCLSILAINITFKFFFKFFWFLILSQQTPGIELQSKDIERRHYIDSPIGR